MLQLDPMRGFSGLQSTSLVGTSTAQCELTQMVLGQVLLYPCDTAEQERLRRSILKALE